MLTINVTRCHLVTDIKCTGSNRAQIWHGLKGKPVREDSADADLFKLLISDFSTGHVLRQHREKDRNGKFLKEPPNGRLLRLTGRRRGQVRGARGRAGGYP